MYSCASTTGSSKKLALIWSIEAVCAIVCIFKDRSEEGSCRLVNEAVIHGSSSGLVNPYNGG